MALTLEQNLDQIFPTNILEEPVNGTTWWVAHTKSRREKTLANFLSAKGIGYYLPLIKKRQLEQKKAHLILLIHRDPFLKNFDRLKSSGEIPFQQQSQVEK
jgi:hypothetical protein